MGIAGVRLAHSLSFGLQVVARDLQFLHKLFDIRDGRRSCGQGVLGRGVPPSRTACCCARARECLPQASLLQSPTTLILPHPLVSPFAARQPNQLWCSWVKGMLIIRYLIDPKNCRF